MSSQNHFFVNQESLYKVDISALWGKEYIPMMDDIVRFVAIQSIIQLMLYTMDGKLFPLFSTDFLLLVMFIVIGVMFYHLVVKRFVRFV
jgi:hypothetical protein